jgi:pimeloyl-ACP methyl ester carboxylesterase
MSRKLICVHGNPGHPTDFFRLVREEFFVNREKSFFDGRVSENALLSEDFDQLSTFITEEEEVDFICYSWGCYLTVKYLTAKRVKANTIIMLNPTLTVNEGVSSLVRGLAASPLVGKFLLARMAPKLTLDFIAKSFAPERPSMEVSNELTEAYSTSSMWHQAMIRKEQMFRSPILEIPKIANEIVLVRGDYDQSVPWDGQKPMVQFLQSQNSVTIKAIEGASHNLLWSHLPKTVDVLRGSNNGKSDS